MIRRCRKARRYRALKATPQFHAQTWKKRRRFERLFLLNRTFNHLVTACGRLALTALIWPRFIAPFRWKLSRHPLPLAGLHPAFHGYRILQLTDLHVGRTDPDYLAKVFARCLLEKPDLIVITGDLIDYDRHSLPILRRLLQPLLNAAPPGGVAAIFGNHDYQEYSWRHVGKRSAHRTIHKRLVQILEDMGVILLRNQQLRLRRPAAENAELIIVGMDEMWTDRADPAAAFANIAPTDPVICLQHNPDGIDFLKHYPWQFMLCGHTHGGQARLPLLGALYIPVEHRQYARGFFHFPPLPAQAPHERTMFVSTGLGYSAPLRMFCPPEATLFTLTASP